MGTLPTSGHNIVLCKELHKNKYAHHKWCEKEKKNIGVFFSNEPMLDFFEGSQKWTYLSLFFFSFHITALDRVCVWDSVCFCPMVFTAYVIGCDVMHLEMSYHEQKWQHASHRPQGGLLATDKHMGFRVIHMNWTRGMETNQDFNPGKKKKVKKKSC